MLNVRNSQLSIAITAFARHRAAMIAVYVLVFLYAVVLLADQIAPYTADNERRDHSYCPPTAIEWVHEGRLSWPFVYGRQMFFDKDHKRQYRTVHTERYMLKIAYNGRLFSVEEPGRIYLWGADARGRDIFSRVLYGGRISLSIGLFGALISFAMGLLIGGAAGYFGGWVDSFLMRVCEMFMLLPAFYLMLALRSAVPENIGPLQIYLMVVLILAVIGWASLARVIRGMSLSLSQRDYVLAARAMGVSHFSIIVKHILPHTLSYSMVAIMLTIPSYIMLEAGLSLFGLGIQDPVPSWGNMLSEAMGIVQIQFAPWIMVPGAFIFITVLCFNMVGDALRDVLDPLYKGSS